MSSSRRLQNTRSGNPLTNRRAGYRIVSDDGAVAQHISAQWLKLLLRLRQLPDGCHHVVVIRDGDDCRWTLLGGGDVEG
ncbi:MAG: hypothetical protein KatS3mg051_2130 [Anaerolineae bacterium]|nr:MAG: hypothetical protein KatS3mg051_2130 [Anaerolineae bacterium]